MSDLLKHLDINHNHEAGLIPRATQRKIREAADLLDECELVIDAMRQEIQNLGGSLEGVITAGDILTKLHAQERG